MLEKLRSALHREEREDEAKVSEARTAAVRAFLIDPIRTPAPLAPPAASNDDPMAEVCVEVERELQAAGLLR